MKAERNEDIARLIARMDSSTDAEDVVLVTGNVREHLTDLIRSGTLRLPESLCRPRGDGYARRLLHRDPDSRYSIVVMTWAPGQGTPIHDHAGIWCVEAVVAGEMEVIQFQLLEREGDRCRLRETGRIHASLGSSGSLIPPFEYHVLRNALPDCPSVTLHVYGGEILRCGAYEPAPGGWHRRVDRRLPYHD